MSMRLRRPHVLLPLLALLLAACGGSGPQTVHYGEENCDYCRMTISDQRFGAQAQSRTGRTRKFDSIECLAGYWIANRESGELAHAWVSDFTTPGRWIRADSAVFVQGGDVHSPMGLGLVAFAAAADAQAARARGGGEVLDWDGVIALVARTGDRPGAEGHGAGH